MAWIFPHDVAGWLSEAEGRALGELAAGRLVLELGSCQGRSTICLAQTARCVHSVDGHRGDAHAGRQHSLLPLLANLRRYGVRRRVVMHIGRFGQVLPVLAPVFDLVFIDGRHDARSVQHDTEVAGRLLRRGGVLAWHDYGIYPAVRAVADVWARQQECVPQILADTLAVAQGAKHGDA